jgi:hypothetical protein
VTGTSINHAGGSKVDKGNRGIKAILFGIEVTLLGIAAAITTTTGIGIVIAGVGFLIVLAALIVGL